MFQPHLVNQTYEAFKFAVGEVDLSNEWKLNGLALLSQGDEATPNVVPVNHQINFSQNLLLGLVVKLDNEEVWICPPISGNLWYVNYTLCKDTSLLLPAELTELAEAVTKYDAFGSLEFSADMTNVPLYLSGTGEWQTTKEGRLVDFPFGKIRYVAALADDACHKFNVIWFPSAFIALQDMYAIDESTPLD